MQVLITFPIFRLYEPPIRERLSGRFNVLFSDPGDEREIIERLSETEILVSNRFTRDFGRHSPRLRLFHAPGAGLDKVDFSAFPPGVRVCQSFGHGPSIAEHVIMVSVALLRRLFVADRMLRRGTWLAPQFNPAEGLPESLSGKTAVILGTGEIGGSVASRYRAFGMRTIGVNRSGKAAGDGFDDTKPVTELPGVLPQADFLVVALPLDDRTRGLIDAKALSAMRPTACLINVARGPVVDEEALFRALAGRKLAGAAIDVWYQYPAAGSVVQAPSRFPFAELDNVIMTPHVSGVARSTFDHRVGDILYNIEAMADGRPLRNEVTFD